MNNDKIEISLTQSLSPDHTILFTLSPDTLRPFCQKRLYNVVKVVKGVYFNPNPEPNQIWS